jgi:hypothetical protein
VVSCQVSHNILNRWKNYFSQLMNVHSVSDVRQIGQLVLGPCYCKVQKYKSPGRDLIPTELFQAGGLRSINALILFEIKMANKSFENVAHFIYLEAMVANQNLIRKEMKRENSGNACHQSVQNLLPSRMLSRSLEYTKL